MAQRVGIVLCGVAVCLLLALANSWVVAGAWNTAAASCAVTAISGLWLLGTARRRRLDTAAAVKDPHTDPLNGPA